MNFIEIAKNAKQASLKIAELSTDIKNSALNNIADFFEEYKELLFNFEKWFLSTFTIVGIVRNIKKGSD